MSQLNTIPPRLSLPQVCTLYVEIPPDLVNMAAPRLMKFADDIAGRPGGGV